MIENLYFWIKKNKANEKHFHDGSYWTYNSIKAFEELFPFWSRRQIERILRNLENQGAIVTGNYNKSSYDRTKWYALTQTVLSIYANGEMEIPNEGNGNPRTVEPIPYNNTDINTYNNTDTNISKDILCSTDMQRIIEKWNSLGLQSIVNIKNNRLKMLRTRIKEYGLESIFKAIENIRNSNYCKGQNRYGWIITFDWMVRPNNFPKVLEGNYNKEVNTNGKDKRSLDQQLKDEGIGFTVG